MARRLLDSGDAHRLRWALEQLCAAVAALPHNRERKRRNADDLRALGAVVRRRRVAPPRRSVDVDECVEGVVQVGAEPGRELTGLVHLVDVADREQVRATGTGKRPRKHRGQTDTI